MSIEQLDLLLRDLYGMDIYMPPLYKKWDKDYRRASYSKWAVTELENFIAEKIYPRKSASIDELCKITQGFMKMSACFSKVNLATKLIFQSAYCVAENVLDLLFAMK